MKKLVYFISFVIGFLFAQGLVSFCSNQFTRQTPDSVEQSISNKTDSDSIIDYPYGNPEGNPD